MFTETSNVLASYLQKLCCSNMFTARKYFAETYLRKHVYRNKMCCNNMFTETKYVAPTCLKKHNRLQKHVDKKKTKFQHHVYSIIFYTINMSSNIFRETNFEQTRFDA